MSLANFPGLQIQSPLTTSDTGNFKPNTWPPDPDFPVVINASGSVVSFYGDVKWDLSPWAGHTLTIHLGMGQDREKGLAIRMQNSCGK